MSVFSTTTKKPSVIAQNFFSLVAAELSLVEEEFERQAKSNVQVISYLGDYLRASGGKRVRPALTILSNYAAGGARAAQSVIRLATVMEYLHTATLVHDDIIDNAQTRRNRASVNARFGNQTAVLMGDWLYMTAFAHSLYERSWPVLDILTQVTRQMTEGELLQLTLIGRTDITVEQYLQVLRCKTAYLFSACCEIGAILANVEEGIRISLREYGLQLGIAFQLVDDLLDCTSEEEQLGKPAGADLLEGKLTLPLIYLLQQDESWRERLRTIMWDGVYEGEARKRLLQAIVSSGARDRAQNFASQAAEAAGRQISSLPDSAYKEALATLPKFILERHF